MIDLLVVWQKTTHCKAIFLQLKYKLKKISHIFSFGEGHKKKKQKTESVVVRWMNLETVILSEVRKTKINIIY